MFWSTGEAPHRDPSALRLQRAAAGPGLRGPRAVAVRGARVGARERPGSRPSGRQAPNGCRSVGPPFVKHVPPAQRAAAAGLSQPRQVGLVCPTYQLSTAELYE